MNDSADFFEDEAEEENYFVSMTDMMVGMLFIFILMLMYYALQVRIVVDGATSTRDTQIQIIKDIVSEVREGGIEVEEDAENGIIRLKNNVLFASGDADVSERGKAALSTLAAAILTHTRCHTYIDVPNGEADSPLTDLADCEGRRHDIDAIFVEGHTDADPISTARLRDNWDLSTARATNTYRVMTEAESRLTWLRNAPPRPGPQGGESIMSVSGYASERPIADNNDNLQKALNRRIDIRIIMKPPDMSDLPGIDGVGPTTSPSLLEEIEAAIPG